MSRRDDGWTDEECQKTDHGYECEVCGYTPTYDELDDGVCPSETCKARRERERKEREQIPTAPAGG